MFLEFFVYGIFLFCSTSSLAALIEKTMTVETDQNRIVFSAWHENTYEKVESIVLFNKRSSSKPNIVLWALSDDKKKIAVQIKEFNYYLFFDDRSPVTIFPQAIDNNIFVFNMPKKKLLFQMKPKGAFTSMTVANDGTVTLIKKREFSDEF
ncbi:MAG: hypothetical protein AB7R69_01850 [Candidatus Babeliales bacterium]